MSYGAHIDSIHEELLGDVAVDSGELMIIDPCYIERDADYWDGGMIKLSTVNDGSEISRVVPEGITFHSGLGDGRYEVYARKGKVNFGGLDMGERIVEIRIVMVENEEEERFPDDEGGSL